MTTASPPGSPQTADLIEAYQATLPFTLDEFQREAIVKLERSRGVLVSAPTSSGKTVVADYVIWRRLNAPARAAPPDHGRGRRCVHDAAESAEQSEIPRSVRAVWRTRIGLVTGEHTLNDGAPILVMTTEILRNVLYDEPARVDRVGDVVLDEIHYIDDYPRGTVWEELIIEAPRHIRLIGLSATISNVGEVAAWMSGLRGTIETVTRTERPVALEMWLAIDNNLHPLFDKAGNAARSTLELAQADAVQQPRFREARRAPDNDMLQVVDVLRRRAMLPAIYFIFSRRGCREALERCGVHGIDLTSDDEKERIDVAITERMQALSDEDERHCVLLELDRRLLRRGLAMHHAGLLPYAKETVEHLFQQGLIKVVFATETLSLGLNMPARSCVISTFTKFDGVSFATLTSGELTQLMGRAGRRGIDTVGHGVILKESDVDLRDIYDAAISGEFAVDSKFSPTYTMVLNLLRTRSAEAAEQLLDSSFGQYQAVERTARWDHRRANLEAELGDLRLRRFQHPRVPVHRTDADVASQHHDAARRVTARAPPGPARPLDRRAARSLRHGRVGPGQRYEAMRRTTRSLQERLNESPCRHCPFFGEHRSHHYRIADIEATLAGAEEELERSQHRFRREFQAHREVLRAAGFLDGDEPTDLGRLAGSLYGESSLLVADAVASGLLDDLKPEEFAATLVSLVAEDRGRERPQPSRRHFPTPRIEERHRRLRAAMRRFVELEREHGLETMPPLSLEQIRPAYDWASGVPLADIEPPPGADTGDVVKAVKSLYSLLRQMEQALRGHALHPLVALTRERVERDLIRRV